MDYGLCRTAKINKSVFIFLAEAPVICNHCPHPTYGEGWGIAVLKCGAIIFQKCPRSAGEMNNEVMLLVHKDIPHMPLTELDNDSESVWVKLFVNKKTHFVASWYRLPVDGHLPVSDNGNDLLNSLEKFDNLFREQLDKIKNINKGNKPPLIHVLGDFNFRDIVWLDRLSKSGSSLSQTEGQILIDIMNDHGLEQLVNFPTRERNTLDLILTSLPGQFADIHSPDKLSDHDIVSGTLKIAIPPIKKPNVCFVVCDNGFLQIFYNSSNVEEIFSWHN